jgi:HK97 family phage major capsid protein
MNVAQLERDLATQAAHASALLEKHTRAAEAHTETVDGKDVNKPRSLTKEERAEIDGAFASVRATKARIDDHKSDEALRVELERVTAGLPKSHKTPVDPERQRARIISPGEFFATSEIGDWLKATKGKRSGVWNSPSVEMPHMDFHAATLTTADTSAGDFIQPSYLPGVVELRYKPLRVRDLIAPGQTDSPIIKYVKETTFTNAAAMVAEGGTKPESTIIYDIVTDEVEKCAHWIPVTEEALEDIPRMRSMIDARLRFGLQLVVDDQLLNGDGTSPNISGILDRVGLATAVPLGANTIPDAVHVQITAISTTAWMPPDGIVMHPNDWAEVARMKDANGQYYGSGPFVASQTPTLWGLPVAVTPTIAEGTALVGAFQTASQWFSKGGVRLDASNSHSDFFIKNLVAVRCEERLALAVYRPGAFGTVTGL